MPPSLASILTLEHARIFRITHRDNVPHVLENGVHCRNSQLVNPGYVSIGNVEIIEKRKARVVSVPPGGTLADYVPFYFTPRSPMLFNIVTGYHGLKKCTRSEVVVLVSSLSRLENEEIPYVIADRNATLLSATIQPGRQLLPTLPWERWRAHDFRHDPNDPEKLERYMAEALVHRLLPASGLEGIITYDAAAQVTVTQMVRHSGREIPVHARSNWYP